MAKKITITSLMLAIVVVASMMVSHQASAKSCLPELRALLPCLYYLKKGGHVSEKCCANIKALDKKANTKSLRRDTCKCIKVLAEGYNVNQNLAAKLPGACKVNLPYAISYSTDCNNIN